MHKLRFYLIALILLLAGSAYAQRSIALKHKLNKLTYDSVKVYSFNCSAAGGAAAEKQGLLWDFALINADQKWAYSLDAKNSLVNSADLNYLFKTLFANELMAREGDPVGCYQPRLGFAFFSKGIVAAHIDICLECSKSELEIFDAGQPPFKYHFWLRQKTKQKLRSLCTKYAMGCCNPQ